MARNYFLLPMVVAIFVLNKNFVSGQGTKQQLTDLAIQLGAPFAKTALERLHGSIFGSGRAARSTDVAIINKSKHSFKLAGNSCSHGVYSTGLFPEFDIAAKSSSVFGVESHGLFTGVECTTRYQSADGAFFEVRSNNPYVGSVDGSESYSDTLKVFRTTGGGDNNQVRWVIEDTPTVAKPTEKPTKKTTLKPTKKTTTKPTKKSTARPTKKSNDAPKLNVDD